MSKETILKEFDNLTNYLNSDYGVEDYRNLFIKAIDQTKKETREETIKGVLPEENYGDEDNCSTEYKNGWNDCREKILNKLKK